MNDAKPDVASLPAKWREIAKLRDMNDAAEVGMASTYCACADDLEANLSGLALPEPVAVKYPDSGLRDDELALSLWRAHGYDTGGQPLYSADQLHSYAARRVTVPADLVERLKVAGRALLREHKIYAEDVETLVDVLRVLERLATPKPASEDGLMNLPAKWLVFTSTHHVAYVMASEKEAIDECEGAHRVGYTWKKYVEAAAALKGYVATPSQPGSAVQGEMPFCCGHCEGEGYVQTGECVNEDDDGKRVCPECSGTGYEPSCNRAPVGWQCTRGKDHAGPCAAVAASPPAPAAEHSDDHAVDRFAAAMKAKLAKKRAEGRGGWDDPEQCTVEFLSELLHGHIRKGDPVDVGNLAMMLHQRGSGILPSTQPEARGVEGMDCLQGHAGTIVGWWRDGDFLWATADDNVSELMDKGWVPVAPVPPSTAYALPEATPNPVRAERAEGKWKLMPVQPDSTTLQAMWLAWKANKSPSSEKALRSIYSAIVDTAPAAPGVRVDEAMRDSILALVSHANGGPVPEFIDIDRVVRWVAALATNGGAK